MWITGFDVPALTVLYNDKPLQKHTLVQTISRVNRRWREKECGVIVDYIGIRENMKEAMKRYGGDVTPQGDVETAHEALRDRLSTLRELFQQLDFTPFFGTKPLARLLFLQVAAEFVMAQAGTSAKKGEIPFDRLFAGHVRVLRAAYDICNPAGVLSEDEAAWAQCFMGILSFLFVLPGTASLLFGLASGPEFLKMMIAAFVIFLIPYIGNWVVERIALLRFLIGDFIRS